MIRRFIQTTVMAATALTVATAAYAQDNYPSRQIRLVVGFGPGTGTDMVARLVAEPLGARLGQAVVVENRPGAGGLTATEALTRAAPDGYTLSLASAALSASAVMKKSLPFDPINDFTWISTVTTYPFVLVVKPDSPVKTVQDFVELSKAEPGKRFYTSPGMGSSVHLVGEWIMSAGGGKAVHVPFQGNAVPLTELLAGRTDLMLDTLVGSADRVKNQQVRAIATTAPKGTKLLGGVPTVADTYPEIEFESWLGIVAPKGVPAPIVARLQKEIADVLASPEVKQKLEAWGSTPRAEGPAEFRQRVELDIQRLGAVVKERNIELQ